MRLSPSRFTNSRSFVLCWRYEKPCVVLADQICSAVPSGAAVRAFPHNSSRTRALGFPIKTPVLGSMSQRDSAFLKLVGTLSTIITSIKHLGNVRQDAAHNP